MPTQNAQSVLMDWWFAGLGGLGGWWFFAVLVFAAICFVWLDSQFNKKQIAIGWKLGVLVPALLLIPTALWWFSEQLRAQLLGSIQEVFLLGLVGGILPLGVALAYFIAGPLPIEDVPISDDDHRRRGGRGTQEEGYETRLPDRPRTPKPKARGLLLSLKDGREYRLYKETTTLGKRSDRDIVFSDRSVSREQALIKEDNDYFTLVNQSQYGTLLNGKPVDQPEILRNGDEIEFGTQKLKFVDGR